LSVLGVNLVILFDKRVRYAKWLRTTGIDPDSLTVTNCSLVVKTPSIEGSFDL